MWTPNFKSEEENLIFEADMRYLKLDKPGNIDEQISKAYKMLLERNENSENMTRLFYHLFIVSSNKMEHEGACRHFLADHFLKRLGQMEEEGIYSPEKSIGLDNSEAIAINMILANLLIWQREMDEGEHSH